MGPSVSEFQGMTSAACGPWVPVEKTNQNPKEKGKECGRKEVTELRKKQRKGGVVGASSLSVGRTNGRKKRWGWGKKGSI